MDLHTCKCETRLLHIYHSIYKLRGREGSRREGGGHDGREGVTTGGRGSRGEGGGHEGREGGYQSHGQLNKDY